MIDNQNILSDTGSEDMIVKFDHINELVLNEEIDKAIKELKNLHHADLADYIDNNSYEKNSKILPIFSDHINPETLIWLSPTSKERLIDILGPQKTATFVDKLDIEDAIDVIEEINTDLRSSIIENIDCDKRQQLIEGFTYPEHTVGRVMEKKFVSLYSSWNVGNAIDYIRKGKKDLPEYFHAAIIIDSKHRPVGNIILSSLLKYPRSKNLSDIMIKDQKIAETHTDLDQLTYIFKHYALTIVPVINKVGKLVGTVSINNIVYIIEEQAEEDILHLGGVNEIDLYQSLVETAQQRFPWLFINLLTAFITALIIDSFKDTIEKLVTLAVIMPIVASLGGNAGTQTMTVTVRALANKNIGKSNFIRIIMKELLSCGLNGLALAIIGGAFLYVIFADFELSFVFGLAVVLSFLAAGGFGSSIPIFIDSFGLDPAPSSGVVLTTITDSFGFFIFLLLAKFMIV